MEQEPGVRHLVQSYPSKGCSKCKDPKARASLSGPRDSGEASVASVNDGRNRASIKNREAREGPVVR